MRTRSQNLRLLEGRFVLARVTDVRKVTLEADLLALVSSQPPGLSKPSTCCAVPDTR